MTRVAYVIFLLALVLAAQAKAYDLPGAKDPALQTAIQAWLDADPAAVPTLLDIAHEGNLAAQVLLTRTKSRRFVRYEPSLPGWPAAHEILDGRDKARGTRGWGLAESLPDYPLALFLSVYENSELSAWQDKVSALLRVGEREATIGTIYIYSQSGPSAVEIFDGIIGLNDPEIFEYWLVKWEADAYHRNLRQSDRPSADDYAKSWTGEIWSDADEATFQAAFAEARLGAIEHQWYRNLVLSSGKNDKHLIDRMHQRTGDLLSRFGLQEIDEDQRPVPSELEAVGEILIAEAEHASYLRPILNVCQRSCADTAAICMYSGFLATDIDLSLAAIDTPLESLIPQSRWHGSRRAELQLLEYASHWPKQAKRFGLTWLELDQCLLDTAQAAVLQRAAAKDSVTD